MIRMPAKMIVFVILLSLFACSKSPPEQAIRENIAALQEAVEARQTGDVLEYIADKFTGSHDLDKKGLRRLLIAQFIRHSNVNVLISKMDVHVNTTVPDKASVEAVVLLTGSDHWLPKDGRLYNVTSEWQLQGGDWLLTSLKWQ